MTAAAQNSFFSQTEGGVAAGEDEQRRSTCEAFSGLRQAKELMVVRRGLFYSDVCVCVFECLSVRERVVKGGVVSKINNREQAIVITRITVS